MTPMPDAVTKTWAGCERIEPPEFPSTMLGVRRVAVPRRAVERRGPYGCVIRMEAASSWTVQRLRRALLRNGLIPEIASYRDAEGKRKSRLTIVVQSKYASQASASVGGSGGVYTSFTSSIYLKASTFTEFTVAHELGHVRSYWSLYMKEQGEWHSYLAARGIEGDPRLDTTYPWDVDEIAAEDFRLLWGSAKARRVAWHLNRDIPLPTAVPGFREFSREWLAA